MPCVAQYLVACAKLEFLPVSHHAPPKPEAANDCVPRPHNPVCGHQRSPTLVHKWCALTWMHPSCSCQKPSERGSVALTGMHLLMRTRAHAWWGSGRSTRQQQALGFGQTLSMQMPCYVATKRWVQGMRACINRHMRLHTTTELYQGDVRHTVLQTMQTDA